MRQVEAETLLESYNVYKKNCGGSMERLWKYGGEALYKFAVIKHELSPSVSIRQPGKWPSSFQNDAVVIPSILSGNAALL